MIEKDVVIIGAGVAGLYLSKILEKSNINYITFDKNHFIGKYGNRVINKDTFRKLGMQYEDVIRPIRKINFYSPAEIVLSKTGEERGYVINLRDAEKSVYRSINNKDNIVLSKSVQRVDLENGIVDIGEEQIKAKVIVIATGCIQDTFKQVSKESRNVLCYAEEIEANDDISVILDTNQAYGFYGWIIPLKPGVIEVGFGTTQYNNGVKLKDVLYELPYLRKFKGAKLLDTLGGFIPTSIIEKKSGKNWIIIGDASGGEPMLGGSIHKAIDEAILASFVINKHLDNIILSVEEYNDMWEFLKLEINKQENVRKLIDTAENMEIDQSFHMLEHKELHGAGLINDLFKNIILNLDIVKKRKKIVTF